MRWRRGLSRPDTRSVPVNDVEVSIYYGSGFAIWKLRRPAPASEPPTNRLPTDNTERSHSQVSSPNGLFALANHADLLHLCLYAENRYGRPSRRVLPSKSIRCPSRRFGRFLLGVDVLLAVQANAVRPIDRNRVGLIPFVPVKVVSETVVPNPDDDLTAHLI